MFAGLEDLDTSDEECLHFKKGDLLHIISTEGDDRWFAEHKDTGKKGYVPLELIKEKLERMRYKSI